MKQPLIVVVGPTASGKSDLAVSLAKRFNGEVISADSMQIYQGMPIATAVITEAEKQGIQHHLTEFLPPDASFSVAEYVKRARKVIDDILSRGKLPILCGGTGLYIQAVTENVDYSEENRDETYRLYLRRRLESEGGQALLNELSEIDPDFARGLHPNNTLRILRALEVFHATGETMTERHTKSKQNPSPYETLIIGICFKQRERLYERIDQRVEKMMEQGLLEEAKSFGISAAFTASQAIGHKELHPYLNGEISLPEAISHLKQKTRNYAKRQITWFSHMKGIQWLDADEFSAQEISAKAAEIVGFFLQSMLY